MLTQVGGRVKKTVEIDIHACNVEMSDDPFVHKKFQKVPRISSKAQFENDEDPEYRDSGVVMQDEWLPHATTRKGFMLYLFLTCEKYIAHQWKVQQDRQARLREQRYLLIKPAVDPNCPEECKNVCNFQCDFSSVLHSIREFEGTCFHPEPHQCNVVYATHSPRIVTTEEIKEKHPRTGKQMEKSGIEQRVMATNDVFFAMSKTKPSAAYHQGCLNDVVSLLKNGHMSAGSHGEAFLNGKRFPPHPDDANLGDANLDDAELDDLPDLVDLPLPDGLTEMTREERLCPLVEALHQRRDGCAGQFQGKSAFLGNQSLSARTGLRFTDCRNPSHHGKCLADGATQVLKGNIWRSRNDSYPDGTQGLVRHLAQKFPSPLENRKARHYVGGSGLHSASRYIYMYYPTDCFDKKLVDAKEGYAGSSKDHYYVSKGSTNDAELLRREDICTCDHCIHGEHVDCSLPHLYPRPSRVRIQPRQEVEQRVTRNSNEAFETFCDNLKRGDVVVVRIHNSQRAEYPEDEYWLGRLSGSPRKLSRSEAGMRASNHFNVGWYVVNVKWFDKKDSDEHGNQDFELLEQDTVMQCNVFVRSLGDKKITLSYNRRTMLYRLDKELDAYIKQHGSLSS